MMMLVWTFWILSLAGYLIFHYFRWDLGTFLRATRDVQIVNDDFEKGAERANSTRPGYQQS